MENKWGIDRLPKLVDQNMAKAFYSQMMKLNEAMKNKGPADVEHEAGRMINAWMALDAHATASGKAKTDAVVWEAPIRQTPPGDDPTDAMGVIGICQTNHEARKLRQCDRYVMVVTVEQVAHMMENMPQLIEVAKRFPAAEIIDIRKSTRGDTCLEEPLDDDLPSNMLEAG